MSRSSVTRRSSVLSLRISAADAASCFWAELPDPGIEAVRRDPQSLGEIGHFVAANSHLPNRLDLEFIRVPLPAHDHLLSCHLVWLGDVYDGRGDSIR